MPPLRTEREVEDLVKSARPFIVNRASFYHRAYPTVDMDDLIQIGLLKLYAAALTWVPMKGGSFVSYSYLSVNRAMMSLVRQTAFTIRVPEYCFSQVKNKECFSLDAEPDEHTALIHLIRDDRAAASTSASENADRLRHAFTCLDDRERDMIVSVYLRGLHPCDMAERHGMTRQGAESIIKEALLKMRARLNAETSVPHIARAPITRRLLAA